MLSRLCFGFAVSNAAQRCCAKDLRAKEQVAIDGGKALALEDYEALRMENKRKLDEMVYRNWDGGNAGVPAAPVPSCSNVRPPLTEFDLAKLAVADIVAQHLAKFKRPRMEEAAEDQSDPVCNNGLDLGAAFADDNFKCVHNQPAEETLPIHHQQSHQGAQFCNRGGSNQPVKIGVPNLKQASAGGAGVVGASDFVSVKLTNDKVSVSVDSGEFLLVMNQIPTRAFAIKVNSSRIAQNSNIEFRWEGAV